jgi:hypothetical protein
LPSSSDLEMVPVAQDINFEEKLEEANSLIEKVRKALKDIGKGIYKVPEHKRAHGDADETSKTVLGERPMCRYGVLVSRTMSNFGKSKRRGS